MGILRVNLRFNQQNLGSAVNVYHAQYGEPYADTALLEECTQWMEDIYTPLRQYMDAGCTFASGQVLEVDNEGTTIRVIGGITPVVSGNASGDQLTLVAAASAFARTEFPKVRGGKRFPGISEGQQQDGLFLNPLMAAMVDAVVAWISERGSILTELFTPGVISLQQLDFVEFAGSAVVTNIPGTQVTRKPLRGQ